MIGYELDSNLFAITLPDAKIIGARNLLESSVCDPGNRISTLRDVQELRVNMTHWQGSNLICRFFAEPVNRMLSFADSNETWIRCSKYDHWHCFSSVIFFLRDLAKRENEWKNLFCGTIEELLPIHKRLSGPRQCLPVLWTNGDATLTRFPAINWRAREFSSEEISDFISAFANSQDLSYINENELIAQAAMVVEWAGSSISEELIPGMGNMSALSWMGQGHARHGIASRIQVGVYIWLALRRIRISPFYLRSSRNISSYFLTRTTDTEITQCANTHLVKRIRLGARWNEFAHLALSLHQYPELKPSCPAHYSSLAALKAIFCRV